MWKHIDLAAMCDHGDRNSKHKELDRAEQMAEAQKWSQIKQCVNMKRASEGFCWVSGGEPMAHV